MKLHIPEFHHHDHHKKVITIHHHHHAPKKEHHHHHHHIPKPHIPQEHHYSHHHKKIHLKTQTVSKGSGHHHGSHGHHGHHHKHHSHHGHHGHHGGHHHDAPVVPSYSYSPSIPSYEDHYTPSYSPPAPSYDSGIPTTSFTAPQVPHVHGISHTVKQVKVFDSLPGALPNKGVSHGYEVTEQGEEGDDEFISVNNLQNTYPATFGYLQGAASQPTNDPFAGLASQSSAPQAHDLFAAAPQPTLSGGIESFTGNAHSYPFASSAPTQGVGLPSVSPSADFPVTFQESAFDDQENSFPGSDVDGPSFIAHDENNISDETPVSFAREAGIQQSTNTGNVETLVY